MGYSRLSKDIKKLIIQKTLLGKHSILQIARECHLSKTSVKSVRRCYMKYGMLENTNKKKVGRKLKLRQEGIMVNSFIVKLLYLNIYS